MAIHKKNEDELETIQDKWMYEQGEKCLTLPFAPLPRQGKCGGKGKGVF